MSEELEIALWATVFFLYVAGVIYVAIKLSGGDR